MGPPSVEISITETEYWLGGAETVPLSSGRADKKLKLLYKTLVWDLKKKKKLKQTPKLSQTGTEMPRNDFFFFLVFLTGVFHKFIMNGKFLLSAKDIMYRVKVWAVYKRVWTKSGPLPALVSKVLLELSHVHLCTGCHGCSVVLQWQMPVLLW